MLQRPINAQTNDRVAVNFLSRALVYAARKFWPRHALCSARTRFALQHFEMNARCCLSTIPAVWDDNNAKLDAAFVAGLESWGSGGEMLDVLVLKDGKILAIMESRLAVYDDSAAFEAGAPRGIIEL